MFAAQMLSKSGDENACLRGSCSQRYMSPEAAYFDPPRWTSLADAKVLGLTGSPLSLAASLPVSSASDGEQTPTNPASHSPNTLAEGRDRSLSSIGDSDAPARSRFGSLDQAANEDFSVPRRWMRGKRGGAKHRKSGNAAAKARIV